jgi:hypothetical protein
MRQFRDLTLTGLGNSTATTGAILGGNKGAEGIAFRDFKIQSFDTNVHGDPDGTPVGEGFTVEIPSTRHRAVGLIRRWANERTSVNVAKIIAIGHTTRVTSRDVPTEESSPILTTSH